MVYFNLIYLFAEYKKNINFLHKTTYLYMKNTKPVQFYSINDISEILNVDYRTIAKRVTSGEIPHYKLGRKTIRVKVEDFNNWLKESHVARNTMG